MRDDERAVELLPLEKCKRDIKDKLKSIDIEWKALADKPNLSGPERVMRKQVILFEIDQLRDLMRELVHLTEPTEPSS